MFGLRSVLATSAGSKNLRVPYFSQPNSRTCQSTVLKMMAAYLEQTMFVGGGAVANRSIEDIWKDINEDPNRPAQEKNAHSNMKWWLEQRFPMLRVEYTTTKSEDKAIQVIVRSIDAGFPVLMSVSHERSKGHILLVIGYTNYSPQVCTGEEFVLIVHDPYGEFDPILRSKLFGKKQWGMSLLDGSEAAAGQAVRLPITSVSRHRSGDPALGTYYLLSASR